MRKCQRQCSTLRFVDQNSNQMLASYIMMATITSGGTKSVRTKSVTSGLNSILIQPKPELHPS